VGDVVSVLAALWGLGVHSCSFYTHGCSPPLRYGCCMWRLTRGFVARLEMLARRLVCGTMAASCLCIWFSLRCRRCGVLVGSVLFQANGCGVLVWAFAGPSFLMRTYWHGRCEYLNSLGLPWAMILDALVCFRILRGLGEMEPACSFPSMCAWVPCCRGAKGAASLVVIRLVDDNRFAVLGCLVVGGRCCVPKHLRECLGRVHAGRGFISAQRPLPTCQAAVPARQHRAFVAAKLRRASACFAYYLLGIRCVHFFRIGRSRAALSAAGSRDGGLVLGCRLRGLDTRLSPAGVWRRLLRGGFVFTATDAF